MMRARALPCLVLALAGCSSPRPTESAPPPQTTTAYEPGKSYFGANGYVEYLPGNMPLIFTAPHGGAMQPADIPVRSAARCGGDFASARDLNTQELAREIQATFKAQTGRYPYVVINLLHRDRLDANRPIEEAACGDPKARQAWEEYHAFIDRAKAEVTSTFGAGWYTDLHGHAHTIQRLELGYLLSASTLRRADAQLDADASIEGASSVGRFSKDSPASFSAMLRGPMAIGTLLERSGYPSVPSAQQPAPADTESYFNGGYSTERHSCAVSGRICGVQIEANYTGVRDSPANRARFAAALLEVYDQFLAPLGVKVR